MYLIKVDSRFPTGRIVGLYFFGGSNGCSICESYYWTSNLENKEHLVYRLLTNSYRRDTDPYLGQISRDNERDFQAGYRVRCIKN